MIKMRKILPVLLAFSLAVSCAEEGRDVTPSLEAEVPENGLSFASDPMVGAEFDVISSDDWYVTSKLDWLKIAPMSGRGGDPAKMLVVALKNTSSVNREGVFSINSGSIQKLVKVRQAAWSEADEHQATNDPDNPGENKRVPADPIPEPPPVAHDDPTDPAIIAWWTVGENDYMSAWNKSHNNCWTASGWIPADWPKDSEAVCRWYPGGDAARTYILSSDGNGHWAVKPTWENDIMEFTVPVSNLKAGDVISARFCIESRVATVPRYWMFEYSTDGSKWTATSTKSYTESGETFNATVKIAGTSKPFIVDESVKLSSAFSGDFKFRLRCINAKYACGGGVLTGPTAGSSLRFTPIANPEQYGIAIYLNK